MLLLTSQNTSEDMDAFVRDLRENLVTSSKQFIAYPALMVAALVTYYAATRLGTSVTVGGVGLSNATLIRRVFLVVPASFITANAAVGYSRRMQHIVYEFLTVPRYPALHKANLHPLRLPSDYISGLFLLHEEGGKIGKLISNMVIALTACAFLFGPIYFIVTESIANVDHFGLNDITCLVASSVAVLLCICSLITVLLSGSLKVEAPDADAFPKDA